MRAGHSLHDFTIWIICTFSYLAHLWTDFQSCLISLNSLCTIQEEDDFYKTTYGGFNDEGDDGDFNYNSPQEDDDAVDSDFSIDENDEVKSDPEDDESSRKKAKRGDGVQTKAYKVDNINFFNM